MKKFQHGGLKELILKLLYRTPCKCSRYTWIDMIENFEVRTTDIFVVMSKYIDINIQS